MGGYRYTKKPYKGQLQPRRDRIHLLANPTEKHYTLRGIHLALVEPDMYSLKKEAKERANHRCEICNRWVHSNFETEDWFKYIEEYTINPNLQQYRFDRLHAVCFECWLFLNPWMVPRILEDNQLNRKQVREIFRYRLGLLKEMGLERKKLPDPNKVYYLSYKGERFINDLVPEILQYAISKGVKIIHNKNGRMVLPHDSYHWVSNRHKS